MQRQKPKRKAKAADGEGECGGVHIAFNLDNPIDEQAYTVCQMLASRPRGTRKRIFVAMLLAIQSYEQSTGRAFDPILFSTMGSGPPLTLPASQPPPLLPTTAVKAQGKIRDSVETMARLDIGGNFDEDF